MLSISFCPVGSNRERRVVKMKLKEDEKIDLYYTVKPMTYFARFLGLWPHTTKVCKLTAGLTLTGTFSFTEIVARRQHHRPAVVLSRDVALHLRVLPEPRQNVLGRIQKRDKL